MTTKPEAAKTAGARSKPATKRVNPEREGATLHAALQRALHGLPMPKAGSIKPPKRKGDKRRAKKKPPPRKAVAEHKGDTVKTKFARGVVAKMIAEVLGRPAKDLRWLASLSERRLKYGLGTAGLMLADADAGRMVGSARKEAERQQTAARLGGGAWSEGEELRTLQETLKRLAAKYEMAARYLGAPVKRGRPSLKSSTAPAPQPSTTETAKFWSGLSTEALHEEVAWMSLHGVTTVREACRVIAEGALEEDGLLPAGLTKRQSAVAELAIRYEKRVSSHRAKLRATSAE
jgi:hypothetical protein